MSVKGVTLLGTSMGIRVNGKDEGEAQGCVLIVVVRMRGARARISVNDHGEGQGSRVR